jgi:hypothetical protein
MEKPVKNQYFQDYLSLIGKTGENDHFFPELTDNSQTKPKH